MACQRSKSLIIGERKDSTNGKYETKYDTNATHCIAPQTSVPRYECFCTRSGGSRVSTGDAQVSRAGLDLPPRQRSESR